MRVKVDWRSSSREEYYKFCSNNPSVKLSFDEWRNIIYDFNEAFKTYILETGEKIKMPFGFGEFSINKKKCKKIVVDKKGIERIGLPIDWKRTKEKGKKIYNFNYHTDGYRFRWIWFKQKARLQQTELWWFKPSRVTSRLLSHYIKIDNKYQHLYNTWKF